MKTFHIHNQKSMTLVELLIAIALLSIIVLGLGNIDIFGHIQVLSSDRRTRLHNGASFILGHMTKEISRAIGNELVFGADNVVNTANISGNNAIRVYIDSDATGGIGDGKRDTVTDRWIAYRFTGATGVPATQYQVWYCPQCTDGTCVTCNPAWGTDINIIARNIKDPILTKPKNGSGQLNANYVTIRLTACWDPAVESIDMPCVDLSGRMEMPSVSVN